MKVRRTSATLVMILVTAACSSDDATTSSGIGPQPAPDVTIAGIPVAVPPEAIACETELPISEWEIDTAVLLPGFVLPDNREQPPATYRLLFQRGEADGYDSVPAAVEAATAWLPAEFQPDIRSVVVNHLGRNYVFEGAVVSAGGVPGAFQPPCLLLASVAQVVVWYSLQVVDPLGSPQVYWIWQQQGRSIAIEPYVE